MSTLQSVPKAIKVMSHETLPLYLTVVEFHDQDARSLITHNAVEVAAFAAALGVNIMTGEQKATNIKQVSVHRLDSASFHIRGLEQLRPLNDAQHVKRAPTDQIDGDLAQNDVQAAWAMLDAKKDEFDGMGIEMLVEGNNAEDLAAQVWEHMSEFEKVSAVAYMISCNHDEQEADGQADEQTIEEPPVIEQEANQTAEPIEVQEEPPQTTELPAPDCEQSNEPL